MESDKRSRRRGQALEHAILSATWAELSEKGYSGLTFEEVARRAGTSRTVLHRRWAGRADLATAAIRYSNERHPVDVPDAGNLRQELALLLRNLSERGTPTFTMLMLTMSGYFSETDSSLADLKSKLTGSTALEQVLARGVARGEIDAARLTPRLASLPLDLVRHEVMMTLKPVSKETIAEILDQIFLPLVRPAP